MAGFDWPQAGGSFNRLRSSILRTLSVLPVLALVAGLVSPASLLAGNVIRGTAKNLSRSQPAEGDDVFLLRLDRAPDARTGPPAVARTKTDAQGGFLLRAPSPATAYLVRVLHQGVAYDERASAGDTVAITVFDARPRVPAITGSIEILRLGTRMEAGQRLLHVSDMFELRNQSDPPVTQAGESTFEVYLPAKARIDSVLAAGPNPEAPRDAVHGEMGPVISAAAVGGEPGHYRVNFPLRPGATRLAFNYDLPYQSRTVFATRRQYAFQEIAVMMPPTMRFSSPSSAFHRLAAGGEQYQVQAAVQVKAGPGPAFEVSGDGPLPPLPAKKGQTPSHSAAPSGSPGLRSTGPLSGDGPQPGRKSEAIPSLWRWVGLAGGLLLACFGILVVWRSRRLRPGQRAGGAREASAAALENLKEELFQLEVDRVQKSISNDEYSSLRLALEETFRRAAVGEGTGGRRAGARFRKTAKN